MSKNPTKKYFVSIIWVYFKYFHDFSAEENYHLHALLIAKELGYQPVAIVRGSAENMKKDPHFDKVIEVIEYTGVIRYLWDVIRYAWRGTTFYVNSYEWQSFVVPFISRKAIFMAHTQPQRRNRLKQKIQNFVYKFFFKVRLNNQTEKDFLLTQNIDEKKLIVVPLVVSQQYFYKNDNQNRKDLVYFGNVTEKKNLSTILKALAIVKKTKPDIKLNVIGQIMDPNFNATISTLELTNNVVLYGFVELKDLANKLNDNLIYLNSSFDEGQCVAVYDSALCGCALCLPKIMSFTGVFKDKALFHDVTDENKLAENILSYLQDPKLMKTHNEACIEMIKNEYSKETVEEKLKKLFEPAR